MLPVGRLLFRIALIYAALKREMAILHSQHLYEIAAISVNLIMVECNFLCGP